MGVRICDFLRGLQRDRRVRFVVAGGFATGLNWLIRFPLNLVMPYAAAVALAAIAHMICTFILYRTWVFPGSRRGLPGQVRDFVVINVACLVVTVGVAVGLRLLLIGLGATEAITAAGAHLVGIGSGAVAGYLGHRRVTFR